MFEATDPRDRVYAVLGLAREPLAGEVNDDALFPFVEEGEISERMVVDYDASVSQVYQRLAKHFINRDLNLDILCLVNALRNEASSDLPSWTPDWRVPLRKVPEECIRKFKAASHTRVQRQDQNDIGRLNVRAYCVDKVEDLLPISTSFWHLLYQNGEAIIQSNGALENKALLGNKPLFCDLDPERHRFRCCRTRAGHIALIPLRALPGDLIYVALGARMPLVLRQAPLHPITQQPHCTSLRVGGNTNFIMVGTCCLPGFMQGEVFSLKTKNEEAFTLV
jgi:hypothetical protein